MFLASIGLSRCETPYKGIADVQGWVFSSGSRRRRIESGAGGPDSPPHDVEGMTLRCQVMELINDILTDTAPERECARTQLRDLLAAHPHEP